MIKLIAKFFVALNSNVSKTQIASGVAWGMLLGLVPAGNLVWIALFLISVFIKHNHTSLLLVTALIKLLLPVIAPLTDVLGWTILTLPQLSLFFTKLYNMPIAPFTRFNNTLVAGGLAAGIALWLPLFFIVCLFIPIYRNKVAPKIAESKIMKIINKIPLLSQIIKAANAASNL